MYLILFNFTTIHAEAKLSRAGSLAAIEPIPVGLITTTSTSTYNKATIPATDDIIDDDGNEIRATYDLILKTIADLWIQGRLVWKMIIGLL